MEFYKDKKKSGNLILVYAGLILVLTGVLLYSTGVFSDVILAKGIAISLVFILFLSVYLIKMLIAYNDTDPQIVLNQDGIVSKVTSLSKAAGLIRWEDIKNISLDRIGGDTLVTLQVGNPDHYLPVIRKHISAMMLKGVQDKNGNLTIYLTASELELEPLELQKSIARYAAGRRP